MFTHRQIVNHLARQIHTLMKYANTYGNENKIYVFANPDIERIKSEYKRVDTMIEKLHFVCMWVQSDRKVVVDCPEELSSYLEEIDLI